MPNQPEDARMRGKQRTIRNSYRKKKRIVDEEVLFSKRK